MSAYLVNDEHINAMVFAVTRYARDREIILPQSGKRFDVTSKVSLSRIGQILRDENQRSINGRYEQDDICFYEYAEPQDTSRTPVAILKALDGYEYQSCESDNWGKSMAQEICQYLRSKAIENLPGYREAEWEITPKAETLTSRD